MAPRSRISLICLNNGVKARMAKPPTEANRPPAPNRPRRNKRKPALDQARGSAQSVSPEPPAAVEASSIKTNATLPPETTAAATKPTAQSGTPPAAPKLLAPPRGLLGQILRLLPPHAASPNRLRHPAQSGPRPQSRRRPGPHPQDLRLGLPPPSPHPMSLSPMSPSGRQFPSRRLSRLPRPIRPLPPLSSRRLPPSLRPASQPAPRLPPQR